MAIMTADKTIAATMPNGHTNGRTPSTASHISSIASKSDGTELRVRGINKNIVDIGKQHVDWKLR